MRKQEKKERNQRCPAWMQRGTEVEKDKASHTETEGERSARIKVILLQRDMSWFCFVLRCATKVYRSYCMMVPFRLCPCVCVCVYCDCNIGLSSVMLKC